MSLEAVVGHGGGVVGAGLAGGNWAGAPGPIVGTCGSDTGGVK